MTNTRNISIAEESAISTIVTHNLYWIAWKTKRKIINRLYTNPIITASINFKQPRKNSLPQEIKYILSGLSRKQVRNLKPYKQELITEDMVYTKNRHANIDGEAQNFVWEIDGVENEFGILGVTTGEDVRRIFLLQKHRKKRGRDIFDEGIDHRFYKAADSILYTREGSYVIFLYDPP